MSTGIETMDHMFQPPRWARDDFTLWETGFVVSERLNKPTKAQLAREFREDRAAVGERLYETED
jgi:hypothetical protein